MAQVQQNCPDRGTRTSENAAWAGTTTIESDHKPTGRILRIVTVLGNRGDTAPWRRVPLLSVPATLARDGRGVHGPLVGPSKEVQRTLPPGGHGDVKTALLTAIALCATGAALAQPAPALRAHPAVVRIVVPEPGGATLGSGALVAVNERHGLVVTNWHVVRDSRGHVEVLFPDGFRSSAKVLKVDRDWDLAALVIWRPPAAPIRLASQIPRRGELLSIAGYGRGSYRMATGRCTNYVSPGGELPAEMVELSAGARQGDSGGPILNQQGELAGVLFGAAWGKTTGSHSGRVRRFLTSVTGDIYDYPAPSAEGPMMAQRGPAPSTAPRISTPPAVPVAVPAAPVAPPELPTVSLDTGGWTASSPAPAAPRLGDPAAALAPEVTSSPPLDLYDQAKTVLAVIGLLAVLVFGMKLLAR